MAACLGALGLFLLPFGLPLFLPFTSAILLGPLASRTLSQAGAVVYKLPSLLFFIVAVNISRMPTNDKDSSKCNWVDTAWEALGLHKVRECSVVRVPL